ncbi:MAG: glycosyltransferase [Solirubrobacterales bacterium]|nr:glycosyltransferase [Solirubrobacterales bacterium]
MTVAHRPPNASQATGLDLTLDRPLPRCLPVGQATAVFCVGSCFHPHLVVDELGIVVDGVRHRPLAQAMPRLDRFRSLHPTLRPGEEGTVEHDPQSPRDPELRSYRSGFWATVPIAARGKPGEIELRAEARLADGTTASAVMGAVEVVGRPPGVSLDWRPGEDKPLIAICMATFNPDMELFRTQVESLRAQTDGDWVCLISDDRSGPKRFDAIAATVAGDPRFVLSRSDERLGFYRNFERALGMVPEEAELVALCDHDDRWYPDKLETLRAAIGSAELAYSDLRLVDADGRVRGESLWRGRRNNNTNLASLLISNTIVGAACLFRRRVLDRALPFPQGPGWDFHDHWLALVAMALGDVAYVDRPLYDYVQHPGAVLGRVASDPRRSAPAERSGLRARLAQRRRYLERWRAAYFTVYLQRKLQAHVLLARCGAAITARKRRALRLLVAADRSSLALAWLAVRPARALVGRNETLRLEEVMVRGILWRHVTGLRAWRRKRPGGSSDDASMPSFDPKPLGPRRRRWLARG